VSFDLVLIDGYSLMHRDPELQRELHRDIDLARLKLVRKYEQTAGQFGKRVVIVFDGRGARTDFCAEHFEVDVMFSPRHMTADTVIERLAAEHPRKERVLVIASDRAELDTVSAGGAETMACGQFMLHLESQQRTVREKQQQSSRTNRGPRLGDFFP
jgi:hypothetical protein